LASQIIGGAEADPVHCSLRIALTNADMTSFFTNVKIIQKNKKSRSSQATQCAASSLECPLLRRQ
jgi:hypothetical protein